MILESKNWLNDGIIYAAQILLKKCTDGEVFGLQSPQNAHRFKAVPPQQRFIQIINVKNNHWITVSNIDVKNNKYGLTSVQVYDSGLGKRLNTFTTKSLCSLMKCPKEKLTIEMMNVEGQSNAFDCGIHAIACATELAFGCDPCLCSWEKGMREHLISCFINGQISRFPSKRRRVAVGARARNFIHVPLYCKCRMPWDKEDPDGDMIECTSCKKWFHFSCIGIEPKNYSNMKWVCVECEAICQ